jgi:hypothetical protein
MFGIRAPLALRRLRIRRLGVAVVWGECLMFRCSTLELFTPRNWACELKAEAEDCFA